VADIKRLLNKKGWTGRELGILELTNMAITFKQAMRGEEIKPLFTSAEFQKMLTSITDRVQGNIYNGYIQVHEWLSLKYNMAESQIQQAQRQYASLTQYLANAITAEDIYKCIDQLPAIMTQKQYEEAVKTGRQRWLNGEDGEPRGDSVIALIYRVIEYYVKQLQTDPKKPNPLKPIRKKYLQEPVTSPIILSRYNKVMGMGYYTLGDGRRSDQMSQKEWQDVQIKLALEEMRESVPFQWHNYKDPPTDLTKWDIIESGKLSFYGVTLCGMDGTPQEFLEETQDFINEFKELTDIIIKDIDNRYFDEGAGISSLPLEEWETTVFEWEQLYNKDFYGFKEEIDSKTTIFDGNRRALRNGIAILRPSDLLGKSPCIDESGYYIEPTIQHALSSISLEAFFPEAEDHAETAEDLELTMESFKDSIYFLKGYNYSIDIIAEYYEVPELAIFKTKLSFIEEKVAAYNSLVPILYKKIKDTDYIDRALRVKKLRVLKDFFHVIEWDRLTIPEKNQEEAKALLKDFKAFKPEHSQQFLLLLCIRSKGNEEYEGRL